MKTLQLMRAFLKKVKAMNLLIVFLLVCTILLIMVNAGQYRYITYSKQVFESTDLENSLYFMNSYYFTDILKSQGISKMLGAYELRVEEIEKLDGVEKVLSVLQADVYDKSADRNMAEKAEASRQILLCDRQLLDYLQIHLAAGSWSGAENGAVPVVAMGGLEMGAVGTQHTFYSPEKKELKLAVSGIASAPAFTPDFTTSGTAVSANQLLSDKPVILAEKTEKNLEVIKNATTVVPHVNMLVLFSESATEEQREYVIKALKGLESVRTYEELMANTDAAVALSLSRTLPIPMFLMLVSTLSFLSLSVLMIYQKQQEFAVAYLCGSSKRKNIMIAALSLGVVVLGAVVIAKVLRVFCGQLRSQGLLPVWKVLIDGRVMGVTAFYLIVLLLMSLLIPYFMIRRFTPIESCRRMED